MNRRYARAREARGLVFGGDMQGRQVLKQIVRTGWTDAPAPIAALLRVDEGEQVWARARELLIDGRIAELSISYFPAAIVEGSGLMVPGDFPPGGVVGVLEDAGHRVLRTYNEARARLATDEELRAFGADSSLQPLHGLVVIEIIHGTYGAEDEALEALVSIRPAAGNVIVFETYEGEDGEADEPAGISHSDTAADR